MKKLIEELSQDIINCIVDDYTDNSEEITKALNTLDKLEHLLNERESEEHWDVIHLINDTHQVVGSDSGNVWFQGTIEECNTWKNL